MLFLGNGDRSLAGCYQLHKLLEHAIEELSGLQQMGKNSVGSPEVRMLLARIVEAFGFRLEVERADEEIQ